MDEEELQIKITAQTVVTKYFENRIDPPTAGEFNLLLNEAARDNQLSITELRRVGGELFREEVDRWRESRKER